MQPKYVVENLEHLVTPLRRGREITVAVDGRGTSAIRTPRSGRIPHGERARCDGRDRSGALMGKGISEILPFAIGIAISPVPIIAVILMLFSPRARSNGPMFLLGWVLGLAVVSGVVYAISDRANAATNSTASDTVSWVKVGLGVLLLALAWYIFHQGKRPLGPWEVLACVVCVGVGAMLSIWPFVLEYRSAEKLLETATLTTVVSQVRGSPAPGEYNTGNGRLCRATGAPVWPLVWVAASPLTPLVCRTGWNRSRRRCRSGSSSSTPTATARSGSTSGGRRGCRRTTSATWTSTATAC